MPCSSQRKNISALDDNVGPSGADCALQKKEACLEKGGRLYPKERERKAGTFFMSNYIFLTEILSFSKGTEPENFPLLILPSHLPDQLEFEYLSGISPILLILTGDLISK